MLRFQFNFHFLLSLNIYLLFFYVICELFGESVTQRSHGRECQTASKTHTDKQTNGQRDKQTDARNRIWCIVALDASSVCVLDRFDTEP